MRFSQRIVMTGGMLFLVGFVGFSWSQEQRRSRSRSGFSRSRSGGSLFELVKSPEVQKSLNLSKDEQAFVALIEEEERNEGSRGEFFRGLRNLSSEERSRKMREYSRSRNKEVEDKIDQVIGSSRLERLKQIRLQLAGVRILFDSRTTEELGITDQQREQFQGAEQEVEEELSKLRREKLEQQAMAIFTSEQKKQWSKMKGEPIDFTIERRRSRDRD